MKRLKISATIGVNEGFFHHNQYDTKDIPLLVQSLCQKEYDNSGIYVSFVYNESLAIYLESFGCPKGGEYTFTLETIATPQIDDLQKWKSSVLNIINECKTLLKQVTVFIEYTDVDVDYLE